MHSPPKDAIWWCRKTVAYARLIQGRPGVGIACCLQDHAEKLHRRWSLKVPDELLQTVHITSTSYHPIGLAYRTTGRCVMAEQDSLREAIHSREMAR